MEKVLLINPRKRTHKRATHKKRTVRRKRNTVSVSRAANPAPRRRRRVRRHSGFAGVTRRIRRRRNPITTGGIMATAKPALFGAGGALLLDLIMGNVPLPASLKTGGMKHITKVALALGIGLVGKNFAGRKVANEMALGAMTVAFHDAAKETLSVAMPTLKLNEYITDLGYYSPGMIENRTDNDEPDFAHKAPMEMSEYIY